LKKLAVLGAGYFQLPLILKAKEMNIETHCFAWADGAVCKEYADFFYPISVLDKNSILEQCKKLSIDGITTIATDMVVPTVNFVAEEMGLIGNSMVSSLKSTNKLEMRMALQEAGCNVPQFLPSSASIESLIKLKLPVIVKPTDRSGSRGVTKLESFEELDSAVQRGLEESFSKSVIVEEFVVGHEISVESISWNGEHHILAITDKITSGAPHFVELAHHQPTVLSKAVQSKINEQVIKCLDALDIKFGAGHTELLITKEDQVFVVEVGARMGGDFIGSHLVQLSTGFDFLKAVIEVALGSFKVPERYQSKYSGVYFYSLETAQLLPYFLSENEFDVMKEIQSEVLKPVLQSNDRSGYLIYQSNQRVQLL
jgi:biotin carboxylase